MNRSLLAFLATLAGVVIASACGSAAKSDNTFSDMGAGGAGASKAGPGGSGVGAQGGGVGAGGKNLVGGGGTNGMGTGGTAPSGDPNTCAGAAALKSYVGCDYWPTVVSNNVWSIFDYAVVVANAGTETASVTVTRAGQPAANATVPPNGLAKVYLPWVPQLKGPDADAMGSAMPVNQTIGVVGGAYHLVSDRPVTVYQFNALEYKGQGGPPGKSWASCPGNSNALGCFSFSNDASLLLPSTAMTGNYRVAGQRGWVNGPIPVMGAYFAITGTQDGTSVKVKMSATAKLLAGAGIAAASAGQIVSFTLNSGDVVELVGAPDGDFGGSLVQADKPVQVIAGLPCDQVPEGTQACDHVEETVFPAETMGKHYLVTAPTGPKGTPPGHVVRLFGNVDGTTLTYGPKPKGAPATINAGQVIDLGVVNQDFEVTGDHEFMVASLMLGGALQDPGAMAPNQAGDPSLSFSTAVEQYRTKYIFLAPDDYDVSYADVMIPSGGVVTLDGAPLGVTPTPIGSSGYGVARVKLGKGQAGAHVLESDKGVGLQIMGFGSYTSYQYPGGLNLIAIAPPPPPLGLRAERRREIGGARDQDGVDRPIGAGAVCDDDA